MWQSCLGISIFIIFAWIISENKKKVSWKLVASGLAMQFVIAFVLLKIPWIKEAFLYLNNIVLALEKASKAGSSFMFGYLGGGKLPFQETEEGASFIVAFQVLPIVLLMSALSAVLFHWGILQKIVNLFALLLKKTMKTGGAMGLGVASSVFLGIIEAPVLIRPYLSGMSRSELFTVISAAMATVAGTVMILYASILRHVIDNALGHIIIASLISAPAAILYAQILIPMSGEPQDAKLQDVKESSSTVEALIKGTSDGIQMVLNIVGIIVVLFSLVSLINQGLGLLPKIAGNPITLQLLTGYLFAPCCWLIGIPWSEALAAGKLMGTKTILNEFAAYLQMAKISPDILCARSRLLLTYAMCGFANFGSLGILVGGMGAMMPDRREEIVGLALKAMMAGTLATMTTAAVIGVLI